MERPLRNTVSVNSLVLMGVSRKLANYSLSDFDVSDNPVLGTVRDFVRDYIRDIDYNVRDGRGIFFCGSNGVGKSMLSCIILKEAYRHRYSCRRVTFELYKDAYAAAWDREQIDRDSYDTYLGAEFLVLEEVGKEIDSKIGKPILEELLRYREEHSLPTIICTNMSPEDFRGYYGNSIASLVNGNFTVIMISARDRRKK